MAQTESIFKIICNAQEERWSLHHTDTKDTKANLSILKFIAHIFYFKCGSFFVPFEMIFIFSDCLNEDLFCMFLSPNTVMKISGPKNKTLSQTVKNMHIIMFGYSNPAYTHA